MPRKGQPKYDYFSSQPVRTTDVDAPDFRESKEFAIYVDTVKAIIYAESEIPSRRIKAELGGLNNDHWTAEALDILCASEHVEAVGVLLVKYRKAAPVERKEVVIDSQKVNEYKAHQRDHFATYPTVGNYYFGG